MSPTLFQLFEAVRRGHADLVCFGRAFLCNPDLVERLGQAAPLHGAPKETWYGGGAEGYIDWPTMEEGSRLAQQPPGGSLRVTSAPA